MKIPLSCVKMLFFCYFFFQNAIIYVKYIPKNVGNLKFGSLIRVQEFLKSILQEFLNI